MMVRRSTLWPRALVYIENVSISGRSGPESWTIVPAGRAGGQQTAAFSTIPERASRGASGGIIGVTLDNVKSADNTYGVAVGGSVTLSNSDIKFQHHGDQRRHVQQRRQTGSSANSYDDPRQRSSADDERKSSGRPPDPAVEPKRDDIVNSHRASAACCL